jgi:predicted transposase YdaD
MKKTNNFGFLWHFALAFCGAEGREEGRAEGRAEERIKNARNLKANGIPLDIIASSLGLSQDEIEELTQNRPQ